MSVDEELFRADLNRLEESLGHRFKDQGLLVQALTHKSYANETGGELPDNERLEFLGDAVLELIVSNRLFQLFPEEGEGRLSRARAAIVRSTTLAEVAVRLLLGEVIRLGRGEVATGGRLKKSVLSDTVEAVFGAVYSDGGMEAAEGLADRLLVGMFDSPSWLFRQDAKSRLQELLQERGMATPRYNVVEAAGPEHDRLFVLEVVTGTQRLGVGTGRSKKEAAGKAALAALERLRSEP